MKKTGRPSINWGKGFCLLFLLVLLVISVSADPLPALPARVQSLLVKMAETNPDSTVSVIVQKTVQDSRVEEAATQLGAIVTQDPWIINGFAAEIKARDVLQLAQANGVLDLVGRASPED